MSYADWLSREYYYMRYKRAGKIMVARRSVGDIDGYRLARNVWRTWGMRYNEAVKEGTDQWDSQRSGTSVTR